MFQSQSQRERRERKPPTESQLRAMERETWNRINQERKRAKLQPLIWDDSVARVARDHSRRMAEANFFDHYDPRYGELDERLKRFGVRWCMCGENIFTCNGYARPAQLAVQEWMKSPGHRQNILTAEFTHTGIGIVYRRDGRYYFTQIFIRPPER